MVLTDTSRYDALEQKDNEYMRLLFRQRLFSWFDSYDIYDEAGNTVYVVRGQLSWGHCLKIYDSTGNELGTVRERILTLLPRFEIYEGNRMLGSISRVFTILTPRYNIDFNGWIVQGSWIEWDYTITDRAGNRVAEISKELLHMTDTYVLDVVNPSDSLYVLMFVLAMDAEKCSRQ